MFLQLAQAAYAASGRLIVEASRFPQRGPGGFSYLSKLLFFNDITASTNAGGAVNPVEWHDLLDNVTFEGAGNYFGPKGLSGADLAGIHRTHTGLPTMFHVDAQGDANAAAAANRASQVLDVFDYDMVGAEPGDTEPLVAYLSSIGSRLTVGFSALPTNATAITATLRVYALTEEVGEMRAVPPVTSERQGVSALTNHTLAGGRLVSAILKQTANYTDNQVTQIILRADGQLIVQMEDQELITQLAAGFPTAIAAGSSTLDLQMTGFGPNGGTNFSRMQQIWPAWPHWQDRRLGKRPVANQFQATLGPGTLTAANFLWLTTTVKRLQIGSAIDQFAGCGCSRGAIEDKIARDPANTLKPKTHSKVDGLRPDMWGYTSIKLNDSSLVPKV